MLNIDINIMFHIKFKVTYHFLSDQPSFQRDLKVSLASHEIDVRMSYVIGRLCGWKVSCWPFLFNLHEQAPTEGNSYSWSHSPVALSPLVQQLDWLPLGVSVSRGKNTILLVWDHVRWHFITFLMRSMTYRGSSNGQVKQIGYFSDYNCKIISVKQPEIEKWFLVIKEGRTKSFQNQCSITCSSFRAASYLEPGLAKDFFQPCHRQNTPALLKDIVPK